MRIIGSVVQLSVHRPKNISAPSEPSWIQGLRRNDPTVVEALYAAHFPTVRQYVLQNSGSVSDAKDVFQEAITVLWLNVKEGRLQTDATSDPGAYLFRVAKYKWLDVLRSAGHKHSAPMLDEQQVAEPAELTGDADERLGRLQAVYSSLDEKCRAILDQFYFERKDLATIATAMGVEEQSIRTLKYRCMMKLRSLKHLIGNENE